MDEIFGFLQEAVLHSLSPTAARIGAANVWRALAQKRAHPSELQAMKETLVLLDLAVVESASLEVHSRRLVDGNIFREAQGVASDAAALAIRANDLPLAVSLLEQGRSTIFKQLSNYRLAIDDVRRVSPELATRLIELGSELDALVIRGDCSNSPASVPTQMFEDKASRSVVHHL